MKKIFSVLKRQPILPFIGMLLFSGNISYLNSSWVLYFTIKRIFDAYKTEHVFGEISALKKKHKNLKSVKVGDVEVKFSDE